MYALNMPFGPRRERRCDSRGETSRPAARACASGVHAFSRSTAVAGASFRRTSTPFASQNREQLAPFDRYVLRLVPGSLLAAWEISQNPLDGRVAVNGTSGSIHPRCTGKGGPLHAARVNVGGGWMKNSLQQGTKVRLKAEKFKEGRPHLLQHARQRDVGVVSEPSKQSPAMAKLYVIVRFKQCGHDHRLIASELEQVG
jgi:hypothetical protein